MLKCRDHVMMIVHDRRKKEISQTTARLNRGIKPRSFLKTRASFQDLDLDNCDLSFEKTWTWLDIQ